METSAATTVDPSKLRVSAATPPAKLEFVRVILAVPKVVKFAAPVLLVVVRELPTMLPIAETVISADAPVRSTARLESSKNSPFAEYTTTGKLFDSVEI